MTDTKAGNVEEGSIRRVDVELFITHPTMKPSEITAVLGLEGHFSHGVGDARKTPKGTSLVGVYPDTRWRHTIRFEFSDQWFADKLTNLVDRLLPHKTFLSTIRAEGGETCIIIQFLGDGYLGDNVPYETLAKIADLRLDFGIECFAVAQSPATS